MSGDQLDLDAIESGAKGFLDERQIRRILMNDVPALVAEVRRLRARLALYDPHAPIPENAGPGFDDLRVPGGDVPPIVAS